MKEMRKSILRHMLNQKPPLLSFQCNGLFFHLKKKASAKMIKFTPKRAGMYYYQFQQQSAAAMSDVTARTQAFTRFMELKYQQECDDARQYGSWTLEVKTEPRTADELYNAGHYGETMVSTQ